ncbi:MAG: DNA mismatch repair protein MutS [Sandaracinaceae bacterium]|nr:DNA mismatch repair protein MutS [Sandaracinaceae bacterium]
MATSRPETSQPKRSEDAKALHQDKARTYGALADALEAFGNRVSLALLFVFIAAVVLLAAGLVRGIPVATISGAAALLVFLGMQVWHARIHAKRDDARVREGIHTRHIARILGEWKDFAVGQSTLAHNHAYAYDIDLVGQGSLVQRLDVTHTRNGENTLVAWLAAAATPDEIAQRQEVVAELAEKVSFREDLEAAALRASGDTKLDPEPFLQFIQKEPRVFASRPWLVPIMFVLPIATLSLITLAALGVVPHFSWAASLGLSLLVNLALSVAVHEALNLIAARKGYAEAFGEMLRVAERAPFSSPSAMALRDRMIIDGATPSAQMKRLETWAGLAELRTQPPIHFIFNQLLLWDLHCLFRLERWAVHVGRHAHRWFEVLGELEALSSLAALLHQDPDAIFPTIAPSSGALEATRIAHPLLLPTVRVANDVHLKGPGSAALITGSNMAGKSTLLRAVGQNIALALAGGPVCAASMTCPLVRLRASMRAEDSLQSGASYFRAELLKLQSVIEDAEKDPPIFFLLDELLRGTNASARHAGSRAIILHLLTRRATGMVATHDTALATLEHELPGRVWNAHFTDVVQEGEMTFDYSLREGVVKTSNALRLLKLAGVDVSDEALRSELEPAQKIAIKPA